MQRPVIGNRAKPVSTTPPLSSSPVANQVVNLGTLGNWSQMAGPVRQGAAVTSGGGNSTRAGTANLGSGLAALLGSMMTGGNRPNNTSPATTSAPTGRPGQPNRPYGGNLGANTDISWANMIGNQYQNAQNSAVRDLQWMADNMRVSGPLQGQYTTSGSNPVAGQFMAANNNMVHANPNIDPTRGGQMAVSDYYTDANGVRRMYDQSQPMTPEIRNQLLGYTNTWNAAPAGGGGTGTGTGGTGTGAGGTGTGGVNGEVTIPTILQDTMNEYKAKIDEANAANEARYQEGRGILDDRYGRNMKEINRLGAQQARDIRADASRAKGAQTQDLTRRGMSGTTSAAVAARGVDRDKSDALNRLGDTVAQNRVNTDTQLSGDIANWIASRNDIAPNYEKLLDLAMQLGVGGIGQTPGNTNLPNINDLLPLLNSGLLNAMMGWNQRPSSYPQYPQGVYPQGYGQGGQQPAQQTVGNSRPSAGGGGTGGTRPSNTRPSNSGGANATILGSMLSPAMLQGLGGYLAQGVGNLVSNPKIGRAHV